MDFYREINDVFGFIKEQGRSGLEAEVEALIAQREEARARKDWSTADAIRDRLKDRGIILEDTPQGVRWRMAPGKDG